VADFELINGNLRQHHQTNAKGESQLKQATILTWHGPGWVLTIERGLLCNELILEKSLIPAPV